MYIVYNHKLQQAALRCHFPGCKNMLLSGEVDEEQWPVFLPGAATAAAADAIQPATMHSRQNSVRWSEDYSQANEMRPYPAAERLMVIRANMGAGKSLGCGLLWRVYRSDG